jgi:5-methyltetrahydropteroyltriglutamate--homocysteine methyltransferase
MKRSTDRILTTHVGSLPRPQALLEMTAMRARGDKRDDAADAAYLKKAVADIVKKQADIGIDIVDDGEFSKPSFVTYIRSRLGGLREVGGTRINPWGTSRDAREFPEFYKKLTAGTVVSRQPRVGCTMPITYTGQPFLQTDVDNLNDAMKNTKVTEAFMTSISLANVEDWNVNQFYKSEDDYLAALANAMHQEYKAIVDAGFLLQVDDPRLITYYMVEPNKTLAECRAWAEKRVEALNHALRGIPKEKVRYHTCYSINMGPRVHDMEAKDLLDIILKVNAGAFSFEAANPRHEHEWRLWSEAKKPGDIVLIPGVVTHASLLVEHPELVAERLVRYAEIVGMENVIAGTDCGFASFAAADEIDAGIAWAKLDALVKGAEIATKKLKSGKPAKAAVEKARAAVKAPVAKAPVAAKNEKPAKKVAAKAPAKAPAKKAVKPVAKKAAKAPAKKAKKSKKR